MATVGTYLAQRLQELGMNDYFAIPGDYNLGLLDELLKNKSLNMINCCNELNAGYAADGYARIKGVSALIVTFSVGGLSAVNAVAGAFAENLPVIVISGGPNTNSVQDAEILHHTLATENYSYVREIFAKITAHSVFIHRPSDAPMQIDTAIAIALAKKKPVYIEIACNIAGLSVSPPTQRALNVKKLSDTSSLAAAIEDAAAKLNAATKPVLIAGSKSRPCEATSMIETLSQACGYALAAMPDAKGFVSEQHPNYIGIYWGPVSSPGCGEIVESSDLYFFIGPNFNDYTTVGHVCNIQPKKLIVIADGSVSIAGTVYTEVYMNEFLHGLKERLKFNDASLKAYKRIAGSAPLYNEPDDLNSPLTTRFLFGQIQKLLSSDYGVLAETGDSWFNGMRLNLPENCPFEIQMQYGSIGWSVGALLGMQAALHNKKRVIALIGDGSFQMSAQELSTLIRYGFKPIIFLMNNASYTIEVQIHDGPYNVINNWRYADLVDAFNGEQVNARAFRAPTHQTLLDAIAEAKKADALCFIEVILDKDDCNKNLLEWGARVASYNSRSPRTN
ncbi:pyruvate decarboxylase [Legionella qingyii]|uniref:pyruvate decarboxylase n=1 Tax=Legionella qingyii TaxID=2184757 RepID=A0A317U8I4_9GAMM|nr:thiamine pyrophosphate-binding protein [Legionella qingyii]PWY56700.1 pyruvate decarboxylase [Legionella qingyii]RUR23746.1 pyruvate decarboxylase [Legionella qingyii]RUR26328.1 pyruvate decarboxylase [Legionella qingyii]